MKKTTLDKLENGAIGKIKIINLKGYIKYRLMDLGWVPETSVKVIRRAPLGDPIWLEIRGYNLSVRKETLEKIIVEVDK